MSTITKKQDADRRARFPLGTVRVGYFAALMLKPEEIDGALERHSTGDWGVLMKEDRLNNERALAAGDRLFSIYYAPSGQKYYVITESDWSKTRVLLPQEF